MPLVYNRQAYRASPRECLGGSPNQILAREEKKNALQRPFYPNGQAISHMAGQILPPPPLASSNVRGGAIALLRTTSPFGALVGNTPPPSPCLWSRRPQGRRLLSSSCASCRARPSKPPLSPAHALQRRRLLILCRPSLPSSPSSALNWPPPPSPPLPARVALATRARL